MARFYFVRVAAALCTVLLPFAIGGCGGGSASQGSSSTPVFAIIHPGNTLESVEAGTLRNFYYGRRSEWDDGTTARPLLLPGDTASGGALLERVLETSNASFRRLWQTRQLSGQGMAPSEVSSPRALLRRVAASRGAVGVLLEGDLPDPLPPQVRAVPIR